jgi:hypothetical protein
MTVTHCCGRCRQCSAPRFSRFTLEKESATLVGYEAGWAVDGIREKDPCTHWESNPSRPSRSLDTLNKLLCYNFIFIRDLSLACYMSLFFLVGLIILIIVKHVIM